MSKIIRKRLRYHRNVTLPPPLKIVDPAYFPHIPIGSVTDLLIVSSEVTMTTSSCSDKNIKNNSNTVSQPKKSKRKSSEPSTQETKMTTETTITDNNNCDDIMNALRMKKRKLGYSEPPTSDIIIEKNDQTSSTMCNNKNDDNTGKKISNYYKNKKKRERQKKRKTEKNTSTALKPILISDIVITPKIVTKFSVRKNWRDSVKSFISSVFNHEDFPITPHLNFLGRDVICVDDGAIIDMPEVTMSNEFLGAQINDIVYDVINVAKVIPSTRLKPVVAVLRGMGGGKTRMLSELRNNLLENHKDTVTIAITFNNLTPINNSEIRQKYTSEVNFSIAIMARVIAAVYNVKLSSILLCIEDSLVHFPQSHNEVAISIIRDCVSILIKNIRQSRGSEHHPVNRLVVIVDELTLGESLFKSVNKNKGIGDFDITSCLRCALLNNIEKGDDIHNEFDFEVALVLSTLTVSPIGVTRSGQVVAPIELPSELSINDIMTKWWKIEANISSKERMRLEQLAACLNSLPRMIEVAASFNIKREEERKKGGKFTVNKDFIKDIIVYIHKSIVDRYDITIFPSEMLLYCIIYGQRTKLTEEVLDCIQESVITNSLDKFTNLHTILPTANIFILGLSNVNSNAPEFSKIIKDAFSKIKHFLYYVKDGGFILEEYFYLWLKVRFQVAVLVPKPLTLAKLFGLSSEIIPKTNEYINLRRLLNEHFSSLIHDYQNIPTETDDIQFEHIAELFQGRLQKSSYEGENAFIANISAMENCECRKSCKEDCFDGLFKFISNNNNKLFYLFWDNKSLHGDGLETIEIKLHQYERIKEIMDRNNLSFLYIYSSTYTSISEFKCHDCVILKDDLISTFFGPFGIFIESSETL